MRMLTGSGLLPRPCVVPPHDIVVSPQTPALPPFPHGTLGWGSFDSKAELAQNRSYAGDCRVGADVLECPNR